VLAIDNLGAGDSQKANPLTEVQQPLQTAIVHRIVQQLRAGELSFAPKASKVIFVGHSLASVIGNAIATKFPADLDALILTG
ncbi:UNVERIFIED_CONTAM: alpha/beta hydrolase, partial [Bacteroidetes bacterium 56_B9]